MSAPTPVTPEPSATVVPLREGPDGPEVLLVQRAKRDGTAGIWVFPGGKVERIDGPVEGASEADTIEIAKRAGARETHEEAGLRLEHHALGLIARWITPPIAPRRFDTWFFASHVERDVEVVVDGSEIRTHQWLSPTTAIEARHTGSLDLAPPTYVTLHWLAAHNTVTATLEALVRDRVPTYEPNICRNPEGACILYPGDAGYETSNPNHPGPRNRLHYTPTTINYEQTR